jgi:hypothetical protein
VSVWEMLAFCRRQGGVGLAIRVHDQISVVNVLGTLWGREYVFARCSFTK